MKCGEHHQIVQCSTREKGNSNKMKRYFSSQLEMNWLEGKCGTSFAKTPICCWCFSCVCMCVCCWFCCVVSFFICWRCFSFSRLCLPVDFCHVHFSITFGLIRWNCETNKKKYIFSFWFYLLIMPYGIWSLKRMFWKTKNRKKHQQQNNV